MASCNRRMANGDIIESALGAAIRELRLEKGWTQEQLAMASGMNWKYLGAVERGEQSITVGKLTRLASSLDTRPSHIFEIAGY